CMFYKISFFLFLTSIFLSNRSFSQDTTAQTYDLQQCIDIAIKNNPDVKQSQFTLESDKVYKREAVAGMLPGISGNISRSVYNGKSINPYTNSYINQQNTADNYGLNASIVLWHGSSVVNFIKQNSLAYEAGKMDLQNAKDRLTINVILAYLSVLSEQEQLKIAKQQVVVTRQQVDRLTIENNKGNIAPSDLYNTRGQLGSNEITVLTTQDALTTARLNLAQLMNIPYAANMELTPIATAILSPYNGTMDDIYQYAIAHLPEVKAAELHDESAKRAVRSARGNLFPTLSLFGGFGTNYSSAAATSRLINTSDQQTNNYVMFNNDKLPVYAPESNYSSSKVPYGSQWKNNLNSNIGLNLSIPILNGLQARSRVKLSKIAEAQTAFQQQTVKILLRQAIERDFVSMTTAYETYKKFVQQVADYSESFREARIKFEAGAINSVDFVITENNMSQANFNLIAAKYNYIVQTKILDYYSGRLVL
ncbi:MAG: TolC family protein, partial [Chitinophagaceae bacterium]